MNCWHCGSQSNEEAAFCSYCGANLRNSQQQQQQQYYQAYQPHPPMYQGYPEQKSRLAAGLLQLFLGGFGVGRFYLGYTGMGVAQIIVTVCTCGIGAIWPFIDGILILTGSVQFDAAGIPLKE